MFRRVIVGALVVSGALYFACSSGVPQSPSGGADAGGTAPSDAGGTSGAGDDGGSTAPSDGGSNSGTMDGGAPSPDGGEAVPVVRFVALGDTGKGNTGQTQVADLVTSTCAAKGCDFVLLLGDNIYPSGVTSTTDPQWQTKFEQPYANVPHKFWAVLGNHDYGAEGAGSDFGRGQHEVDYTQVSQKWEMPAKYYRRTLKHVEFFGLDTNMQMYGADGQQEEDVAQWLSESTAVWKIVLGHHPYLSNGPHGNAGNYDGLKYIPIANGAGVKSFAEKIWCGKSDVYLSGHDHTRQWMTDTCQGTELIVSGTGAEGTELKGSNPTHFETIELGLVWIEISGRTFTAEFIGLDGTVEHKRSFTK